MEQMNTYGRYRSSVLIGGERVWMVSAA
jgi:hypothetical protein